MDNNRKDNMLVSVVIPCYNVEKCISDCLKSALNQSYHEIEIICVDDGSEDDTYSILLQYAQKYPGKIQVLRQNNLGAPVARNRGLEIAKGDYIQFLDADDILLPDKISRQVEMAINYIGGRPDFIVGNYMRQINDSIKLPVSFTNNVWVDLLKGMLGTTCSNLWNKKSLHNVNGWDQHIQSSQEIDLMFRILKTRPLVIYDTTPLTVINVRTFGSISTQNRSENYCRFIRTRGDIVEYLKHENLLTNQIITEYNKILFNSIKLLYLYNSQRAIWYFNDNFPKQLSLEYLSHSSLQYKVLFFLFGFGRAEQISNFFKKYD